MRISGDKDDPGYETFLQHPKARILLDGAEINLCITADDELGFVLAYKADAAGVPLVKNTQFITEIRHGKVQILLSGVA